MDGERKQRKRGSKVKRAKAEHKVQASTVETSRWARCLGILLLAALLQALLGFILLQGREVVQSPDFLVSGGVAGPLAAFADPEAPFVVTDELAGTLDPGDLAVLVLASGRKAWLLRATLQSLSRVDGLRAAQVLVSMASAGREVSQEFGFQCVAPAGKGGCRPSVSEGAGRGEHLGRSLSFALETFRKRLALVVLEEGQVFSLDLLWYFVQLVPVVRADESLFCATAWNENGLAPYAADATVLLRGDQVNPVAWMTSVERVKKLLELWKEGKDKLSALMSSTSLPCVYPEVSRVALASADCLRPSPGPLEALTSVQTQPVTAAPSSRCATEETQRERISMASVTSGHLKGYLGDVRRMQAAQYEEWLLWRWPMRQGMFYSEAVFSVSELDARLGYEPKFQDRPRKASQPLRLVLQPQAGNSSGVWLEAAAYFGLSDRPRGVYKGVLRLRWRDVLLYLVVDPSSVLLSSTEQQKGRWGERKPRLSAEHFQRRATGLPKHRPIPPQASLSAAPLGESCARHCEAQGHVCVDADLTAVAVCAPPLTLSFGCTRCEMEATSAAFPGLHRDTGHCGAGRLAPGAPGSAMMAGDCGASAQRVRRLCVCRQGRPGVVRLRSPGLQFAAERKKSLVDVASVERLEAFQTARLRSQRPANLSSFAPPRGRPVDYGRLVVLYRGEELPKELNLTELRVVLSKRKEGLRMAIEVAREAKAAALLILEEGQRWAPDLLPFMIQLQPVLLRDRSLWCVSAWNDQGIAPYVADPTVVLRVDSFSGVAWMVSIDLLESEILSRWKEENWLPALQGYFRGRQCLVPEVSRAVPGEDLPILLQTPLSSRSSVDLGDVTRLEEVHYLRLLLFDWPHEGLWHAKPLTSLRPLTDGRANSDGPYSLIFRCSDVEKDVTWKAVANFFGLWPEVPIRTSFMGVLRLRWRDSVLFLIASSSSLLQAQVPGYEANLTMLAGKLLAKSPVDPMLFYGLSVPFLRPPGAEVLAAETGVDCVQACQSFGRVCLDEDLAFVNHCAALGSLMNCRSCETGSGPALPAHMDAGDHMGVCLLNTGDRSCSARHTDATRLCACRSDSGLYSRLLEPLELDEAAMNVSLREGQAVELNEAPLLKVTLDAPILVLASAGRHELLQRALKSLAALPGYRRENVVVSQDGSDSRARWVAEELFKVAWVLHDQEHLGSFDARVAKHLREALSYVLKRFPTARSLIVVEEDMEAANDMLHYFAQLEPLLHQDNSLWCIGAWNENGMAPFAHDLAGLIRTDVFAGTLAWMLPAELYRSDLLNRWPREDWVQHFRNPVMAAGRQCIVPEVSRVRHVGRETRKDVAGAPELAALQDARLVVSHAPVQLAVSEQAAYENQMRAALRAAQVLEDLSRLPPRTAGGLKRWYELQGYRLRVQGADRSSWHMVADFFQLSQAFPVPNLYHNVLMLRWGAAAVLYLLLGPSELVEDLGFSVRVEAFHLAVRPLMVPRESIVAASRKDVGRSCTSICEDLGKVCYSADLLYINSCRELRDFFSCSRCEANKGADQPALWTPQRRNKASGACLVNSDVIAHTPACDADHPETQRLCCCREALSASLVESEAVATQPPVRVTQEPKLMARAEAAGWKEGLRAEAYRKELKTFARAQAPPGAGRLPVLLVAAGDRAHALNETVMSLLTRGVREEDLLISLGCCGVEVERSKRLLEVHYPQLVLRSEEATGALRGRSRLLANSARDTEHLRQGLSWALRGNASHLLVVHEGTQLSPDALPFFQQLETLLEDPTIWCIGAWNAAGLAPYSADLTVLLRTDYHPASYAWMMRAEILQELLKSWPGAEWERFLRMDEARMGRHCVIPEVSRCAPTGPPLLDDPALRRGERAAYEDFHQTVFWNEDASSADLGDLQRVRELSYEKLILHDWPSEGLAESQPASPRALADLLDGNHHLVLDDRHASWPKVASFFKFASTKEMRLPASYKGHLRLRWRAGVLHLIMWNSPLVTLAGLTQKPKRGQEFPVAVPRRAPVVSIKVGVAGRSCHETCGPERCHDTDLIFLNGCAEMRAIVGADSCGECLTSHGEDYPAALLLDVRPLKSQEPEPSLGSCLWNANLARPPKCGAAHPRLARLCPCRPNQPVREAPVMSTRMILRDLSPSGLIDELPSRRCGAMFGNRLAADCVADGYWCCSGGMWCGNSALHCKSPDHECRGGASASHFCGAGWTLRVPAFER